MSIRLMAQLWEHGPDDRGELLVLLAMADNANDDTGLCNPSIETIARKARMEPRSARRIIRKLEQAGWITTEAARGRSKSNCYTFAKPDTVSGRTLCQGGQNEAENRTLTTVKPDTCVPRTIKNQYNPDSPSGARPKTPSLATVKQWAERVMAPEDCATCFHAEHEARPFAASGHWTDKSGQPVNNPQAAFTAYATRWKANNARQQQPRNGHKPVALQRNITAGMTREEVLNF